MAYDDLHHALMALPETGSAGFEGFVRDLLADVSGETFKLMKSGPQGGVDAIGEPRGNGLAVGMEGKRYGLKTHLALDALKSKLRDAASTFPALDLWVLATTRGIDGGDTRALAAIGEGLGVEVLVLDWDSEGAVPPLLAVLCAAAPLATAHHLANTTAVLNDLEKVRANGFYAGVLMRLRAQLQDPATGLASARSRLRELTLSQMRNGASARLTFDSNAVLEAPGTLRVTRFTVDQALNRWWAAPDRPATLLGPEGMGKTWALLAWWLGRSGDDPNFPLTVIVPARDVDTTDAPALIARALHKATNIRDFAFWQRRVLRWSGTNADRPLILLGIDGLNQNWRFRGWSDLIVSTQTTAWKGKIATVFTCRPDHFQHWLKSLGDLPGGFQEIGVGAFDDSELDALLLKHGLTRNGYTPALLQLIRKPRLSRLAIEQAAALSDGGEVTAERLVYEDWRHRHPGAQRVLSHNEFKEFVATLGHAAAAGLDRGSISRKDLLDRLSVDGSGPFEEFHVVISELIDGGWLESEGPPNRFRLRPDRVPAALGLALVAGLRKTISHEEAEEHFADLFEPLQDSDIAVGILRNAATFALADDSVRPDVRRMLLERWTIAQNFSAEDFEAYWRLVGLAPRLALDVAEWHWFGKRGQSRADEVFVKGFANAWRWPEVANCLKERLLHWFSCYWLDWLEGEVLGQVVDDEQARERRRKTAERAECATDERIAECFGFKLQLVDAARQSWGSSRAVELLSWLPRAPLVDVFTAWAITSVVLGGGRQFKAMAWVLRWNAEDGAQAEQAILSRINELLNARGRTGRAAAKVLLDALATPAARRLHDEQFGSMLSSALLAPAWAEHTTRRNGVDPFFAAPALVADSLDPEFQLPQWRINQLVQLAAQTSDEALLVGDGPDRVVLDYARTALARWAPSALVDLIRRRFAAAIKNLAPKSPGASRWVKMRSRIFRQPPDPMPPLVIPEIATELPRVMLVLDDADLAPWRRLSKAAATTCATAPFGLHATALAGASAAQQISLLATAMPEAGLPDWSARLLEPPKESDLEALAAQLEPTQPTTSLVAWLHYVGSIPRGARQDGWDPIARLIRHQSAEVRAAAFKVIAESDDQVLAEAVAESGWRFEEVVSRHEVAWGSLALVIAPSAADGSITSRVHPDALGELLARHPSQKIHVDAFAEHVQLALERLRTGRARVYPQSLLSVPRGWDELLQSRGKDLLAWMQPFTGGGAATRELVLLTEQFPILRALDATDTLVAGAKAGAVVEALRESRAINMRSADLYKMAVEVSGPGADEARELALTEANTDKKLFEFATGLQRNGHRRWLLDRIEVDLAGDSAGTIARGLVLAGFLLSSEENDAWWADHITSPASGWLFDVHRWAVAEYRRFAYVRHWVAEYRNSLDDTAAMRAHDMLLAAADDRLLIGEMRPSSNEISGWSWRRRLHWSASWPAVKASMKKHGDALDKRFLASELPLQNQSPRRH